MDVKDNDINFSPFYVCACGDAFGISITFHCHKQTTHNTIAYDAVST